MIVKTYNDLALCAFRAVRDTLADGDDKPHGNTSMDASVDVHLQLAMRHILNYQLIASGAKPDDGEPNHLRNAATRVILAIMQTYQPTKKE